MHVAAHFFYYLSAHYQALLATVRASIGENVTIKFLKENAQRPDNVYLKRLPGKWLKSPSYSLPLHLTPASPSDTGIHILHNHHLKTKREKFGAYYDVLVRGT